MAWLIRWAPAGQIAARELGNLRASAVVSVEHLPEHLHGASRVTVLTDPERVAPPRRSRNDHRVRMLRTPGPLPAHLDSLSHGRLRSMNQPTRPALG